MTKEIKQDGKRGKRRRWKTRRPNPKPELTLPPKLRSALGLRPFNRGYFEAIDQVLVRLHKRYDDGDRSALLDAIYVMLGILFPAWVREGFAEAWMQYRYYKVKTIDEAFGIKRPKGQHLKAARDREVLREQIIFDVYYLHAKGAPLDQETFAKVGRDLGISGGEASKIFSEPESDDFREIVRNLKISN